MKRKVKASKVNRMTPWVCRDGTRTCVAVMSTGHIASSLAVLLRAQDVAEGMRAPDEFHRYTFYRRPSDVDDEIARTTIDESRTAFIPVFLAELNARLRKKKFGQ